MKKIITVLLLLTLLLFLTSCDESSIKTVPVKYYSGSIAYPCHSDLELTYPVHFKLPDKHGYIEMDLVTSNSYAFMGNMTDALTIIGNQRPYYDYTGTRLSDLFDAVQEAIDVIVSGVEVAEGVYAGNSIMDVLAPMISGQRLATYYVKIVDYDGNTLERFTIPIGKTTIKLSSRVQYVEVRSSVYVGELEYAKAGVVMGSVGYDNAHEIENETVQRATFVNVSYEPMDTIAPMPEVSLVPIAESYATTLPTDLPARFAFSSGAGGWGDVLNLNSDGSFTGEFFDSEWSEEYPGGIERVCQYNGRFEGINFDGAAYSLRQEDVRIAREVGTTWVEDNTLYEATGLYGMDGTNFKLYLPGTTVSVLPADFDSWYSGVTGQMVGDVTDRYVLVNLDRGYIFIGE